VLWSQQRTNQSGGTVTSCNTPGHTDVHSLFYTLFAAWSVPQLIYIELCMFLANAVFGPKAIMVDTLSATRTHFLINFQRCKSDTILNNKEYSRELAPVSSTPLREHRMKKILLSASHHTTLPVQTTFHMTCYEGRS
jgi:hypothetical protein